MLRETASAQQLAHPPDSFGGTVICLPVSQHRQADGALDRRDGDDHKQRPEAELKSAAFAFRQLGFGRLGLHGRIICRDVEPEQGIRGPRRSVPWCALVSDSRFNGPGLLQNQLKGKVDAEVVERS
jgi:hypothetical protein